MARPAAILLILALTIGTAIAGYLAAHHENKVYGDATLTLANCPETETVNCDLVNSSAWSELGGVPIAALAIPTYLLLIGLVIASRRVPAALPYVFCIGLLTVAYSIALFVISKTQVGFLCLWCMRLYGVNISIPILAAFAARRSPYDLIGSTSRDLRSWPRPMRLAAVAFVLLLVCTVAGDRAYRAHVRAVAAEERARIEREGGPTVPAVPQESQEPPAGSDGSSILGWLAPEAKAAPPPASPSVPYKLAGPLRLVSSGPDGVKSAPFDLQARIGAGKPIALIFFAPGFAWSGRSLVEMAAFFKKEAPQIEVFAVSGRRDDQRDEEILEAFALLGIPSAPKLLVDDQYAVMKGLAVADVPNVALFSSKGTLVIAKIKDISQLLITSAGNRPAGDVIRDVAKSVEVPQIQTMFPYYPSQRLLDRCAPPFTAKTFGTGAPFAFKGKSASGRPTLVMFWSSTCKHCQVDIPKLVAWVSAHPGKADVIGVTIIKKDQVGQPGHRAITDAYIRAQKIPWPIVEDVGGVVSDAYASISTPTTLFVSPSGTVSDIWYYAHDEGFDEAMERSLTKARAAAAACSAAPPQPEPRLSASVMGPDGKRVELATLLDKPALVHFWATWCKPCVAELPSLMQLKSRVEKSGAGRVVLVSVESEADGARIAEFGKSLGLDLKSYRAPKDGLAGAVDLSYRLPRTFVVAPGGAVLDTRQGSQNWGDPAVAGIVDARLAGARAGAR
jgi:thiol-disulfide isomerase/thioredoxin/uncharacterized membrane protein